MVTQNVINGFTLDSDVREIRDFPREFKISTVDFVYQRLAFLIQCFPQRTELIKRAQNSDECQKLKKKILRGDNDLAIVLSNNDDLADTSLDILAYMVSRANKYDAELYVLVEHIMYEADDMFSKMFDEGTINGKAIADGFRAAIAIFLHASKKEKDKIKVIVNDLDSVFFVKNEDTEAMMNFVKDATPDIWNVKTMGELIVSLRDDIDCRSAEMPEMADFFAGEMRENICQERKAPIVGSRPRIDMCMASFRIATSLGVCHNSLYSFKITDTVKRRICSIMAMSSTTDPKTMVHRTSIDRGIKDAYIALIWQYVVATFGCRQQKEAILEKSTTIQNNRKLKKQEDKVKTLGTKLLQKEQQLKKEEANINANARIEKLNKELYALKSNAMKRENALRDKLAVSDERIKELEQLLVKAEKELIQLRPETPIEEVFDDAEQEEPVETIDYHKELARVAKNKKIVFCGGQQNYVNQLRNAQPDISYVDECILGTCDALIANSDIVIFRVTQMSHSLYGKVKQICKARGIRFEHMPNVTSVPLSEELIYNFAVKGEEKDE